MAAKRPLFVAFLRKLKHFRSTQEFELVSGKTKIINNWDTFAGIPPPWAGR